MTTARKILVCLASVLGCWTTGIILSILFPTTPIPSHHSLLWVLCLTLIIAPVGEELIFRGLPLLIKEPYRMWADFILCVLFAVAHYSSGIATMATAFLWGIISARVIRRFGLVWCCGAHIGFNTFSVLVALIVTVVI